MATSAFKSKTKRTPIGTNSKSDDSPSSSSTKAPRRSRSLSRFSHRLPDPDFRDVPAPRGKFVNTTRGSGFPEISLDDLAIEFFPLKSSSPDEPRGSERGRLSRRSSDVSPATTGQTTPSQRRGRSVSRQNARAASDGKSGVYNNSKSNDTANLRRRRSVSVARYHISDSESDIDQSWRSNDHANKKSFSGGNSRMASLQKPKSDRRLVRSHSQKDLLRSHDEYSSHSSALTDDEAMDAHYGNNDVEKTIRAVYAQRKTEHPTGEDVNGGLYQAMRKELRYAVEEIRTELEQAMVKGNSTLASDDTLESRKSDVLQAVSAITKNYATKLEQSEKRKQDLLAEILLEEQRGKELTKIVKELLPESKGTMVAQNPLRARRRSNDRNRMSRSLTEEAEKYFEDFISNVEDTDISSIDGERSDASSSLGGVSKGREAAPNCGRVKPDGYRGPAEYNSWPVEMDGVILPWLQWETSNDGSPLPSKIKTPLPVTPKTFLSDAAQDLTSMQDSSGHSSSGHGAWSPALEGHSINNRGGGSNSREVESFQRSRFDMDEYIELQRNEELLFERWRERDRISSGGLLLCSNHF